jgi:hypothetical protein
LVDKYAVIDNMNIKLVPKEDVSKNYGKSTRHTKYKRCFKCWTRKVNLNLTEIVNRNGRLTKNFLCDLCDKIK